MSAPEAALDDPSAPAAGLRTNRADRTGAPATTRASALAALSWAALASTLHRVRRGEGALLAVNVSLIAYQGGALSRSLLQAIVSALVIGEMYAFNDLYDAPMDWNNPKKDRTLIAAYVDHRRAGGFALLVLHLFTAALAFAALGRGAGAAAAAVMIVNVVYSTVFKGVPVVDVAWCALWGGLYAAIVAAPPALLVLVGLMTAVCHLFQTMADRIPDAANGIRTTAVRSSALSRQVLLVLSSLLFLVLRAPLGTAGALTAFTPLGLAFVTPDPGRAWLLTKVYFGALWLYLLGVAGAVV
jgi:4-hydroxybenzoate polyprenyltransferase